jgi:hypothetical protein
VPKFLDNTLYSDLFEDLIRIKDILLIGIFSKNIEKAITKVETNELLDSVFKDIEDS